MAAGCVQVIVPKEIALVGCEPPRWQRDLDLVDVFHPYPTCMWPVIEAKRTVARILIFVSAAQLRVCEEAEILGHSACPCVVVSGPVHDVHVDKVGLRADAGHVLPDAHTDDHISFPDPMTGDETPV